MATEEDRPTTVTCLACGGEPVRRWESGGQYRHETCRWCTGGRMSAQQIEKWREKRREPSR